jgi:hypothetical protein
MRTSYLTRQNAALAVKTILMGERQLYLISASKSRGDRMRWSEDDYDVRNGAPDGPVVGRIYKLSVAPTGNWWFWAVQLFPAVGDDTGTAETREAAMAAFKAQWIARRGWEHPWVRRT